MKHRRFGPLAVDVPIIGLGTWQLDVGDRESAIRAVRHAIDLGMTHIDTAEIYGQKGAVEELLGEALAGYRGEVFLASKVHPDHATYAGTLLACEKSLRRLRTDRLDLYLLHWLGGQPLEETIRALETLVHDGKIRAWGVSNFEVNELERAIQLAGAGRIACNQVLYNLEERNVEHIMSVFCERHHIALVGYSPLGGGRPLARLGTPRGDVLASIASRFGVSRRAVVLAYLTRRDGTFVIPKSVSLEHLDALAKAGDLTLESEDIRRIDELFPLGPPQ